MTDYRIVVIGASAGGVEALQRLVKQLPPDLKAAVFVAVHFPAGSVSFLTEILNRSHTLSAMHPKNGEAILPGHIYVAQPDYHLLIHADTIELRRGPKENGHRPAIDTMFRSAAQAHGDRVIGVVLTGMLDDGTYGLQAIKSAGGIALVQDPNEAMFRNMPDSAIAHVELDGVLPLAALADYIVGLVANASGESSGESSMAANSPKPEEQVLAQEKASAEAGQRPNAASPFTCPDCGGVLWELRNNSNLLRFRCHIGHAYSLDSLVTLQGEAVERALWIAVRAIEEKAALSRRLTAYAYEQNRPRSAEQFSQRAAESESNARLVRQLILEQQEMRLQGNTIPEQVEQE